MRREFDPTILFAIAMGLFLAFGFIRLGWFLLTGAYDSFMDPKVMARFGQFVVLVAVYFAGATLFNHFRKK
jgi:hypothetical protein